MSRRHCATTLTKSLSDVGLELQPTAERLDAFHAVQNTYLSIFQLLGALGLLLGSVGLGLVVLRNTQERRGELALLSALGFVRASPLLQQRCVSTAAAQERHCAICLSR